MTWWEGILRLFVATLLGALLGMERETQGKAAGFRTHILVTLGSALFVVATQRAALQMGEEIQAIRAAQAIAQGIGFLGAGVILQSRGKVRGLTTAASLWASSAVGLTAGLGMYLLAVVSTLLMYFVLHWLQRIEREYLNRKARRRAAKNARQARRAREKESREGVRTDDSESA
jgi:putative Mg2+ transporter-C (MgtC) family protein